MLVSYAKDLLCHGVCKTVEEAVASVFLIRDEVRATEEEYATGNIKNQSKKAAVEATGEDPKNIPF